MISTIRRQFAKQPQPRRRRLYAMLWFGLVIWIVGFGSLLAGTLWPGRPLGARIFSGVAALFVVGVTGAFWRTFNRLDRAGAWNDHRDRT